MTDPQTDVSRRGFLRTAAGATTAAAAIGEAAAQTATAGDQEGTPGGQQGTPDGAGTPDGGGGTAAAGGETRTVEMTDELAYEPEEITVSPGDTIEWVNVGRVGHTVTAYAEEIPPDAEYFASGGFESMEAAVSNYVAGEPDAGYIPADGTYSHTFETPGDYEYYCIPHETAGMVGSVTVSEGGAPAPGDGDGGEGPLEKVPAFARNLAMLLTAGLLGILSFTYLVIKFGGNYSLEDGE